MFKSIKRYMKICSKAKCFHSTYTSITCIKNRHIIDFIRILSIERCSRYDIIMVIYITLCLG